MSVAIVFRFLLFVIVVAAVIYFLYEVVIRWIIPVAKFGKRKEGEKLKKFERKLEEDDDGIERYY